MENKVKSILQSDYTAVLNIAGGGTHVIPTLLENGGGSAFLLEANIPYSQDSFDDLLNSEGLKLHKGIDRYVSPEAAAKLSIAAFRKAEKLNKEKNIGIGVTAKLSKGENEREGRQHELHVAFSIKDNMAGVFSIQLNFERSRLTEEVFSAKIIMSILEKIIENPYKINTESLLSELNLHSEDNINISEFGIKGSDEFLRSYL